MSPSLETGKVVSVAIAIYATVLVLLAFVFGCSQACPAMDHRRSHRKASAAKTGAGSVAKTTCAAWLLEQKHAVTGQYKVYVAPRGLRVENLNNGIIAIAGPPDWTVVAFSCASKKYALCKPSEFQGSFCLTITASTGQIISAMPLKFINHGTTCGVKSAIFQTTKSFEESQQRQFLRREIHPSSISSATLTVADSLDLPVQEGVLLARLFGIPMVKGVPLELKYSKMHGGKRIFLSTSSIKSKVVPASLFLLPSGYKQMKSMELLTTESASGQGGIEMILDQMYKKKVD